MTETILYQWPPALGTESIFPRCVVINRICNVANQSIKIVNMGLPKEDENYLRELQLRLTGMPVLIHKERRLNSTAEIVEFLIQNEPAREAKSKLSKLTSAHSFIIQQWSNDCFLHSLVYARWFREENYQRFILNVRWPDHRAPESNAVTTLRQQVLAFLHRSGLGGMKEVSYMDLLKKQLWSIENILASQEFIDPLVSFPTMTDLNIFMVIQGLLSPDLEESQLIRTNFPSIIKWYESVDRLTSKHF